MTSILALLLAVVMVGILGVLAAGILGVASGGSPRRSNALMRARVWLQGLALALIALILMLRHH